MGVNGAAPPPCLSIVHPHPLSEAIADPACAGGALPLSAVKIIPRMLAAGELLQVLARGVPPRCLADYAIEPDDPTRDVPNPKRTEIDHKLKLVRAQIAELQRQMVAAKAREAIGGEAKVDKKTLKKQIWKECQRAIVLNAKRERVPIRVPVAETTEEDIIKLATQKKHLTNVIKLVAYQAESELVRMIVPHYRRAAIEGCALIQAALASAADIKVTDSELLVTLAPLSSPHRTHAVAALCDLLNATGFAFPGTRLRMRYAVAGENPKPDISAGA